jgi:D-arginine dehydrogenase
MSGAWRRWRRDAGSRAPRPLMFPGPVGTLCRAEQFMDSVDVCIIGGGMAGASVAFHLAPHASLVLLEREPHVGYHSTGRSAAMYVPQYGSPVIRRLTAVAGSFLRAPPADFAPGPLLSERGALTVGSAGQRAVLEHHAAVAQASGQALTRLTSAEARVLVPALKPAAVDWALLDRTAQDMDVEALLQGFLRGARAHGAHVVTDREVATLARDAGGWRVTGREIELRARIVVNAAGAWADDVAHRAGIAPLGLVPHRRTAFVFDGPEDVAVARWPMVLDAEELFYFKPEAGRLLGSLAEEVPSPPVDAQPDELDVAIAVDRIEQAVDFSVRRVLRSWTGLRIFGRDRDPVSGFEPGVPGFYWHAAIGGYGIQTAPALGAFAAATILGQEPPPTLAERGLRAEQIAPQRLRG